MIDSPNPDTDPWFGASDRGGVLARILPYTEPQNLDTSMFRSHYLAECSAQAQGRPFSLLTPKEHHDAGV